MMPALVNEAAPVPPPAYHRAQARLGPALHIDALTLVNTLHLLTLCRLAVRLAHRRCPSPLPASPGGAPCTDRDESQRLIAVLRTLWRLSYRDMRDWLRDRPAVALACGLPLGEEPHRNTWREWHYHHVSAKRLQHISRSIRSFDYLSEMRWESSFCRINSSETLHRRWRTAAS